MSFEVETTYDKPTVQAFQRVLNKTIRYKRIRLVRVVDILMGCASLIYGLLWLWARTQADVSIFPAVSGLALGVVFLLIGAFYEAYISRGGRHMVNHTPTVIRYSFDKHGYTTKTGKNSTRSVYGILKILCADERYYVLMLDRRRGFVLDREHFLSGNPEDFGPFLEERTGKKFQMAKP